LASTRPRTGFGAHASRDDQDRASFMRLLDCLGYEADLAAVSPRAMSQRGSPCTARSLSRSRSMSPSPNTSGNAGSSGNPLSLASDAATVLHPYRQNRRREVLITNANLRGQPNAVEATPGRTTGPFLARRGGLLWAVVPPARWLVSHLNSDTASSQHYRGAGVPGDSPRNPECY